ncbi:PLP-dependent aminotransferase family protein [Streptomyces sp. Je 1-369]|uniref:MocR-like transcription factor YczR n=1 Tax=Streptomyces sp. Je 1-369 TaxID=2966192 RepID=UPI0022868E58|nr:PLP-dependent aminotransferase family protein [Streptomyces sp. Je 1-369]WAM00533.1 PLP-dependent aminotransferase family protein [Streptomyces sp. Je 1-369]
MLPDPSGTRPAYRHLAHALSGLILDGRIALHVRLPAERDLAVALGTSRTTVTAMYDLLRSHGYAHSRQGAGTWTALPEKAAPSGVRRLLAAENTTARNSTAQNTATEDTATEDTVIDLARAAPGLPGQELTDTVARIAPRLAEHAHTPGYHPYGLPELRAAIAGRFTRRGLATVPEQILVTSGAQHALTLVLGLLCGPGDRVLTENPSYPNALEAMRRARLRPRSVPVTEAGWDVGVVEAVFRETVPQLAYLIPDFHNPTGCLMPEEERIRVLRAAQRSGSWLVVDETLAELALDVPAPPPLASHAAPGGAAKLITVGSMSKTHWAGLRIGWLRAPARLVTELAGQRVATDMGGSVLDQLVALDLLGRTDALLPARLERLRVQRAALCAALEEHFPAWSWSLPPGGLSLWVDLGEPVASALAERARDKGVRIESGSCFATDPGVFEQRLRIPYTAPPDALREAVRRMAVASAAGLGAVSGAGRPRWVA